MMLTSVVLRISASPWLRFVLIAVSRTEITNATGNHQMFGQDLKSRALSMFPKF
jgi:hypothetical protein